LLSGADALRFSSLGRALGMIVSSIFITSSNLALLSSPADL
jgi:hypothetical protein